MNEISRIFVIIFILFPMAPCQASQGESALLKSAMQFYSSGNYPSCARSFLRLARYNPTKALYWFNLGNCLFMAGSYNQARLAYGKVIKLKSPLSPAAMLYQGKALKKMGRGEEAKKILEGLVLLNPPEGILAEARQELESTALVLYQQGKYAEAEAQIRAEPERHGTSSLLLGMVLMKQNKNAEAEEALKAAALSPDLSAADRGVAKGLLLQLKAPSVAEKAYWVFLDGAYGSTSNAYLEGRSYSPVSSPLFRVSAGGGYRVFQSRTWTQKISYIFDYEDPTQAPELKTQTHSLQLPSVFNIGLYEFGFVPYLQEQLWDGSPVTQKTGALFRNTFLFSSSFNGGCDIEVFSQKALREETSYLAGSSYSARPFTGFSKGAWIAQIYWLLGSDGTQDIIYSDGSRLPLQNTYQGPGAKVSWRATTDFSLLFQMVYLERSYKNNSLPEDKVRKDHELNSSLKLVYSMTKNWVAYAMAEYNPNKSTLGDSDVRDKNYDNFNMLAGVGGDLF